MKIHTIKKLSQIKYLLCVPWEFPYEDGFEDEAIQLANQQADEIQLRLKSEKNIETDPDLEIIALIAYLQRLGTDIKVQEETASAE
jgi:cytochrome c oxidase cbb3-type subunit I/II